jgi:hypothetical protein
LFGQYVVGIILRSVIRADGSRSQFCRFEAGVDFDRRYAASCRWARGTVKIL